jgi:hypothetical protein
MTAQAGSAAPSCSASRAHLISTTMHRRRCNGAIKRASSLSLGCDRLGLLRAGPILIAPADEEEASCPFFAPTRQSRTRRRTRTRTLACSEARATHCTLQSESWRSACGGHRSIRASAALRTSSATHLEHTHPANDVRAVAGRHEASASSLGLHATGISRTDFAALARCGVRSCRCRRRAGNEDRRRRRLLRSSLSFPPRLTVAQAETDRAGP